MQTTEITWLSIG